MRTWIAILLLVTVAFAGCAGDAKEPSTEAETPTGQPGKGTTKAPTGTGATPPLDTTIPALGHAVTEGDAPLLVNFSLSAQNATDSVAWTLESELAGVTSQLATGTTLPAEASHVFADPGQHNLTFTVTSNGTSTLTKSVVTVIDAGPGLPADLVSKTGFKDAFTEDQVDATNSHQFEVLAGAKAVTIMGDWNGGLPESDNWGYPNDLDVFLKNPAGGQAAASEMLGFEFMHHEGELAPGTWTLDILAYDLASDVDYAFNVLVWYKQPTRSTETGSTLGDVDIRGEDPYQHTFDVPSDAQAVVTFLTWKTAAEAGYCNSRNTRSNDLDLSVTFGGAEVFGSGYFHSCEFGFVESGPDGAPLGKGGPWTVDVVAFLSPAADYKIDFIYA